MKRVVSNKRAFTLIELLVVVLIIGVLAAVAVPQYQKAVWKARLSEVWTTTSALEKAMDLYVLENSYPDERDVRFVGTNRVGDIEIRGIEEQSFSANSKYFQYSSYCTGEDYSEGKGCHWGVDAIGMPLYFTGKKLEGESQWTHYCEACYGQVAEGICQSLYAQGWQEMDENC